ncbi:MAG: pyruvate dehydrogenase E2 component (dihydrolipoamide acetyltransferase) [Myxococcota bacterium]|jgi:pyruvate dehydrogenase E2 component (dihydrolipoamide acetyltransferase)
MNTFRTKRESPKPSSGPSRNSEDKVMSFEFKLPDIGEGVVEGEIVSWLVAEGDVVTEDQPLVEVLTDKATVVIPSPKAGKVVSVPWVPGDTVPVGDTLVVLDAGADESPEPPPVTAPDPETVEGAAPDVAETPHEPEASAPRTAASASGDRPADIARDKGRVLAAPATRKLARTEGIDLSDVEGTGKHGRITREDVERFGRERGRVRKSAPAAAAPGRPAPIAISSKAGPGEPTERRIKLKGIRKAQAEGMVRSFFTAPHFTYVEEIDVTDLTARRKKLKGPAADLGASLSYLPFIIKGVVAMLKKHEFLNASLDEAAQEIVFHKVYNIGIAVATDHGLMVPVVHAADRKSIVELAKEVSDKSERARALKLTHEDLSGSTFTITSLGKLGGILATPILNLGEVAILGVHNIFIRPKWDGENWLPREVMNLSLSFDHRVVDGFTGATAVQYLKGLLEDPDRLLLEMP